MEMFVANTNGTLGLCANMGTDYIVYDVWIFVELVVIYFLFIETRGSSLEEIAIMIDGPDMTAKMMENVEIGKVTTLQENDTRAEEDAKA